MDQLEPISDEFKCKLFYDYSDYHLYAVGPNKNNSLKQALRKVIDFKDDLVKGSKQSTKSIQLVDAPNGNLLRLLRQN